MARIRSLKIGFFQNEGLAALSPYHRLLFAGLWVLADKAGRLSDRPSRIKAQLFPYETAVQVDEMLTDLERVGFVIRYRVRGDAYLSVPKFAEHQRPHHKEPDSVLPEPPKNLRKRPNSSVMHESSMADASPVYDLSGPGEPGADPLGSGILSLVSGSGNCVPRSKHAETAFAYPQEFEGFWSRYPKKRKKGNAFVEWKKLRPDAALVRRIHSALDWQINQPEWLRERGRFIADPERWLKYRRFDDEPFHANDPTNDAFDNVAAAAAKKGGLL